MSHFPLARLVLIVSLPLYAAAYQGNLATLAIQKRTAYNGGWPLGISSASCPSDNPGQPIHFLLCPRNLHLDS